MERFAQIAAKNLTLVLEPLIGRKVTVADLETPPDPAMGDFGFPCFKLSKELKKAPPVLAQEIAQSVTRLPGLDPSLSVKAVGPYVNFLVDPTTLSSILLKDILSGKYGEVTPNSRGSWVLEYSSPNIAKPLNIYHLRPTALGAALDRIGRLRGYRVISINHLGDWGKQYGMLTVAFRRSKKSIQDPLTMKDLVDLYVWINKEAESDPSIEEDARAAFVGLEKGDPEVTAIWKRCCEISLEAFDRSYKRLNVKFDHIWGESFYKDQLTPLLDDLRSRNILIESEGAWVVPVTDEKGKELPPCILQKQDGATIYATRDVAAAVYRYKTFNFDRMTYIVGQEQKLHFQQVFGVLRAMKQEWVSRCEHVPFGLYRFKDAKMSTRKGNFVTLEEVLEEAKLKVRNLIQARDSSMDEKTLEETAERVAIGAVVFHDLHTDPSRDVEFDIDRVVDFEGETGPYLQYAHTRCLAILRKANENKLKPSLADSATRLLNSAPEVALIKTLGMFAFHLERTLSLAKASQLAHYLIDVTKAFGLFYRECRVIQEIEPELSAARLALVDATRTILNRGLSLMGIPLPDKM